MICRPFLLSDHTLEILMNPRLPTGILLAFCLVLIGCTESEVTESEVSGSSAVDPPTGADSVPGGSATVDLSTPSETMALNVDADTASVPTKEGDSAAKDSTDADDAPAADTVPAADGEDALSSVTLKPGDPAPPVMLASVVQGDPLGSFGEKVVVVEFWATWCGPCRTSMPHMSSLQESYGDKIQFVGISDENEATVGNFMEQDAGQGLPWSEVIKYTIALDEDGATNEGYMRAANQRGIPAAFIVGKSGNVEWIGHPMTIDEPLEQVVNGTWDVAVARKQFETAQKSELVMMKVQQAFARGDLDTAILLVDDLLEDAPNDINLLMTRISLLARAGKTVEFNGAAKAAVEALADNAQALNAISWIMAAQMTGEERDLGIALSAAKRAAELTDNGDPSILETLARVHYEQGNLTDAITTQTLAVAADPDSEELKATLENYQAEANPKKSEDDSAGDSSEEPEAKQE